MSRPIRTLLFSTLYPSSVRPIHGIFVETRLRELLAAGATPVIVEGALDAYAVTQASDGAYVGVAPSGTALTAAQTDSLAHAHGEIVTWPSKH